MRLLESSTEPLCCRNAGVLGDNHGFMQTTTVKRVVIICWESVLPSSFKTHSTCEKQGAIKRGMPVLG